MYEHTHHGVKNLACGMSKFFTALFLLSLLTNCKTAGKNSKTKITVDAPAAFLGDFTDDYGIRYSISDSVWLQHPGVKYYLLRYDSTGQYFIAQNANTNPSEGGLYTRIDVMQFSNMAPWHWGFCLTEYKAKTMEEAISRQAADRGNPRKGCNGYPFSRMKKSTD
jgi:hypothetical protein